MGVQLAPEMEASRRLFESSGREKLEKIYRQCLEIGQRDNPPLPIGTPIFRDDGFAMAELHISATMETVFQFGTYTGRTTMKRLSLGLFSWSAALLSGCGSSASGHLPPPALDLAAPQQFETATFSLG